MYISFTTIFIMSMITFVITATGAFMGSGKALVWSFMIGVAAAIGLTLNFQHKEIRSWQYEDARSTIAKDCRLADLVNSILADRIVENAEYWRLQDREAELRLADARAGINGDVLRQCPSKR